MIRMFQYLFYEKLGIMKINEKIIYTHFYFVCMCVSYFLLLLAFCSHCHDTMELKNCAWQYIINADNLLYISYFSFLFIRQRMNNT